MERRPFLALLTTAVAGCGATDSTTETPATPRTETEPPTEEPTPTTTPTPTSTPTEEPTDTPTGAETEAREAIAAVRSTLGAVLEQYRGDAGETILAADAAHTGFADRTVQIGLTEAKRETERAREAAVTDAQRRTVENLATTRHFLDGAAETQVALVGAYRHLQNAHDAFAAVNPTTASEAVETMDAERRIARSPYRTVVEETDAEATAALPPLATSTYRAKLAQFDAEMGAFGALRDPLDSMLRGIGRLESALALRRNGSTAQAEQMAASAAGRLDTAAAAFAAFADGLGTPADSLVGESRELSDLAATKAAATRERFALPDAG